MPSPSNPERQRSYQIRDKTKTVTRRKNWLFVKPGDILNACVKCIGLKPGEAIERICQIRVTDVRREKLSLMLNRKYGDNEAKLEGFPAMYGDQFVYMFCKHMGGNQDQLVTRIEFEYV
jgi:hypothetical protein